MAKLAMIQIYMIFTSNFISNVYSNLISNHKRFDSLVIPIIKRLQLID